MEITIAKNAGFCFGVKRAIKIARQTAKKNSQAVMLGEIVHNENVIKEIQSLGISTISRLAKTKTKTLIIRAHGVSEKTYYRAKQLGYKIIDATCPMVKEIHLLARRYDKDGYKIIIIGDKKHDEVKGIIGQILNPAIVIANITQINKYNLSQIQKAAVLVQSTRNEQTTLEIVNKIKKKIPALVFNNTICLPTRLKQKELDHLARSNDLVIIIGSRTSANTRHLYELASLINKKTYWIQSAKQINAKWFINVRRIAITAGASTPNKTIQDITRKIRQLPSSKK